MKLLKLANLEEQQQNPTPSTFVASQEADDGADNGALLLRFVNLSFELKLLYFETNLLFKFKFANKFF